MDVIVPYGIKFKKCNQISYSGYKKTHMFPFIEKNLIDKKSETVMALVAELHSSSYYNDLFNFIIYYYSNYNILSNLSFAFFLNKYLQKIQQIKSTIQKKKQDISLINSNEIRNIFCSIFSNLLESKINKFSIKIEKNCYLQEIFLLHSNLNSFNLVIDKNNVSLSDKLSRGLREVLYFLDNSKLNVETIEKILYWIHWCIKIESIEKKLYKGITFEFESEFPILEKINKKNGWEFFLWHKIWQANLKNNMINKNLLKSLTKLFFHNYIRTKLKDRSPILAAAVIISNSIHKIKIERKITKMEIFTSINANKFYKNILIDENNDEEYLKYYNEYNNIKAKNNVQKIYKINSIEKKMDFLREYIPNISNEETKNNIKNVSEYFST